MIRRDFIYLWYYFSVQLEQIFGYWVLGIVLGSFISVFAKDKIHSAFSGISEKRLGVLGLIPASLLGIASPLCMYGTIPITASFSQKGLKDDMLAAFMTSSILLNPQLLIYSGALGTKALVIRFASCFLCGVGAGICVRYFFHGTGYFKFTEFKPAAGRDTDPNLFTRLLKNIGRNIKVTGGYFLLGILLSALFQRYVTADIFESLFQEEKGFGILMAAAIGVPLYACGGGTIPLLQQWLDYGMSMGAAAAFMITGPATKITNVGALKIVMSLRHFVLYFVYIVLFSFVSGLLIEHF